MLKLSFLEGGVSSRCHSWSPLTRVAWAPGPHGLGPHTPPASPLWCSENFSRFCVAGSFLTKARDLSKGRLPCKGRPDEETEAPGGFETCLASTRSVCEVGTAGLIFRLQEAVLSSATLFPPPGARPAPSNPTKDPNTSRHHPSPARVWGSSAELSRVLAGPSPAPARYGPSTSPNLWISKGWEQARWGGPSSTRRALVSFSGKWVQHGAGGEVVHVPETSVDITARRSQRDTEDLGPSPAL